MLLDLKACEGISFNEIVCIFGVNWTTIEWISIQAFGGNISIQMIEVHMHCTSWSIIISIVAWSCTSSCGLSYVSKLSTSTSCTHYVSPFIICSSSNYGCQIA